MAVATSSRARRWWIWGGLLLVSSVSPGLAPALQAANPPFPTRLHIADDALDRVRGGFVLPNGMDVSLGIGIETRLNGVLALRTELTTGDDGIPIVFSGTGGTPAAPAAGGGTTTTIPGVAVVHVVEGTASPAEATAGRPGLELTPNGPALSTPSGSVQLIKDDMGSTVVLHDDSLELRHMIGSFTGAVVANTANDRTINTVVTVDIDLHNSAVPLGNALLHWESIAIEAASRSIR
ncbi:hypothetical protein [Rhizorhabdus argentea]|uniref:hypothetical protein n=1 Tax=Rhizorhabdus argentea TaxID=1387174 RepID=UPI0030ECE6A9